MSIATVIAVRTAAPGLANRAITAMFSGFSIASVIGLPLGIAMGDMMGWRSVFTLVTFMAIIALGLMAYLLPHDIKGSSDKSGSEDRKKLFKDIRIILGVLVSALSIGGIFTFYTYLTTILVDMTGIEGSMISAIFFVYGISCIVGNMFSSRMADRYGFGMFPPVFVAEIVLLIAFIPAISGTFIIGMIILLTIGFFIYLVNTTNQSHFILVAMNDYPLATNLASSLNTTSFNMGIIIGSIMGSIVITSFGLEYLGYAGAICTVLALVAVLMLNKVEKDPKMKTYVSAH